MTNRKRITLRSSVTPEELAELKRREREPVFPRAARADG